MIFLKKYLLIPLLILSTLCFTSCGKNETTVEETKVETKIEEEVIETPKLTINFIDIQEGDSTLISLPNKKNILINVGKEEHIETILSTLDKLSIDKIDYLIGTYPNEENMGGFKQFFETVDITNVVLPSMENNLLKDIQTFLDDKITNIIYPTVGQTIYSDFNTRLSVLAPNSTEYKNKYNHSLVLKLDYKEKTFLFQGNAEKLSEEEIVETDIDINADVIKIANYGKDTSTTEDYIALTSPQYAIISTVKNDKDFTPSEDTKYLFRKYNVKSYETGLYGTIEIKTDGKKLELSYSNNTDAPPTIHEQGSNYHETIDIEDFKPYSTVDERIYIIEGTSIYHTSQCEELLEGSYSIRSFSEVSELNVSPCQKCH